MTFYSNMLNTADSLISTYGRDVTIRREKNDTEKANPWEGYESEVTTYATQAVFMDDVPKNDDGTLVKREFQTCLVPAKGLTFTIELSDKVVDGSDEYEILDIHKVQPGDTLLMYKLRITR